MTGDRCERSLLNLRTSFVRLFVIALPGDGSAPSSCLPPEARTQTLQFDNRGVFDEQIDLRPEVLDDATWQEWVDSYIVESKRFITVRRNNVRFKQLEERGVDIGERKDGIQIRLTDFDSDMH